MVTPPVAMSLVTHAVACAPSCAGGALRRRDVRRRLARAPLVVAESQPSAEPTIRRRDALLGALASFVAAEPASAAVKLLPEGLDEQRRFFQTFPPLWEPYFGWGERVTVRRELVPGVIWSLEQEQALDVLAMNVRTTVVKLERTGGLVVFSPQAPTEEFFRLLDELGRVEHVVIPTYAIEHKVFCPAFQRRYPSAQCWVAEGLWSVPVDLPLEWIGINPSGTLVPGGPNAEHPAPPWFDEIDYKVLRVDTAGANPYIEATFLHRASRSLLVTDLVLSIPTEPPEVISRERLLDLAPDDPADAPAAMSDEALRVGWAKASLVVSFLGPSRQEQTKEGKLRWEPGYQKSFALVSDRLIPSPILRTLVFDKGRGPTRRFLDEVCADWGFRETTTENEDGETVVSPPTGLGFDRIIPAHYDAPVRAGPDDLRRAFAFLDAGSFAEGLAAAGAELPEEDMGTLLKVNDVLERIGLGKGTE